MTRRPLALTCRRLAAPPVLALAVLVGWGALGETDRGAPRRHLVEIQGMAFRPESLVVAPGDTVEWINRDIVPHTATAPGREGWDTGVLPQGGSGRYVVRSEGALVYSCALHPPMRARLVIRGPAASP